MTSCTGLVALEGSLGLRPCERRERMEREGFGHVGRTCRRRGSPRRLEGRGGYSAGPGRMLAASPARRRLMGLGDKTATILRPELAANHPRGASNLRRNGTQPLTLRAKARRPARPPTGCIMQTGAFARPRSADMADRVGFEPTEPLQAQRFSRPPRSTTPAPLRAFWVVRAGFRGVRRGAQGGLRENTSRRSYRTLISVLDAAERR